MNAMIEFMKSLLQLPKGWVIWVGILFSVNLAGVFFLPRVEAIVGRGISPGSGSLEARDLGLLQKLDW